MGETEEGNWVVMSTSPKVEAFVPLVREYCKWIEAGNYSDLSWLYLQLAKLQVGILQMPTAEPETDGKTDAEVPKDEYESVCSKLDERLSLDVYWEMFEPPDMNDKDPVCGSLRGDIGEIWRDLKEDLLNYDEGRRNDAIFGWKLGFETHWGRHLTSALRVLYAHLY